MGFESVIGFLAMVLPVFLITFVLRWIRFLYHNYDKQVKQNEKIIELLIEIKKQKKNSKGSSFAIFSIVISLKCFVFPHHS
ncbi:hypothetical protein [Bacillus sp. XF8]|uniref:hypothetical protein n=1 Tax=Bacillus sp. XF8 TaxID=2819289 RepID=UPI001AA086B4|nr:hypothetical protein [Bacillus sp. XF8]MBO1580358.1 hypothetical protein [Bacillus sp. XF8]